jgi:hypothetical protein
MCPFQLAQSQQELAYHLFKPRITSISTLKGISIQMPFSCCHTVQRADWLALHRNTQYRRPHHIRPHHIQVVVDEVD